MAGTTRRTTWVIASVILVIGVTAWRVSVAPRCPTTVAPASPQAALDELKTGNRRYVESRRVKSTDTGHDADDRHELAGGQHPFAAVLCCADSRLCPEFIFDQRPGSMFEIRNAGNLVDDDVLASFEYAVEHFHVPLLVVLGHKRCGAIKAVHDADGELLHHHLKALQEHMAGLKEEIHRTHHDHSQICLDRLALENARQQAAMMLRDSEPIAAAIRAGTTRLLYALYDMETGEVEFFELSEQ